MVCIEKDEQDGQINLTFYFKCFLSFYPKNVYTVSFPKPGFVELSPVPIDVGTEINLSFSTKNESGIILLGSGGTPAPPRRKRRQTGQVPPHLVNNAFSLMLISNSYFIKRLR